jgi:hypothetical protein
MPELARQRRLFRERYNHFREAGDLGLHTRPTGFYNKIDIYLEIPVK